MTESENDEDKGPRHETIRFGPWNVSVSKDTMRQLVPYVGWSFLITAAAIAAAACYWGVK
jgi:hypothetical protein